jgi:hypothetical protein
MIDTKSAPIEEVDHQADSLDRKNIPCRVLQEREMQELVKEVPKRFWSDTLNCNLGPKDKRLDYATREELRAVLKELERYIKNVKKTWSEIQIKCDELGIGQVPKNIRSQLAMRKGDSGLLYLHTCQQLTKRNHDFNEECKNRQSLQGLSESDFKKRFKDLKLSIFYNLVEKHLGCEKTAAIQKEAEERAWARVKSKPREQAELH